MSNEILCPECGKPMDNKGNVDRVMIATLPPQYYDTYVCESCKLKKKILHPRKHYVPRKDYKDYREIK